MQKQLSKASAADFEQLLVRVRAIHGCACAQEAALGNSASIAISCIKSVKAETLHRQIIADYGF